ncbi:MAG: barstar family protein [Actinomycetota bacterium]|nr:barstar family protein [Actinomycetota bacterium]
MSGLAGLLAGRRPAGVYRWDGHARTADVAHTVEHAGWRFVHLDTARVEDKQGFLRQVRVAYGFPDWFGANFDALADALTDVRHDHGTVTLWEGWSPFARARPGEFSTALDVLGERCRSGRGGAFAVLLRGDGPAVGLPDLDPHGPGGR